jgi:predicted HicB family RNase H-like nuclease
MQRHTHAKQERIIEAVRQELEGDAAVEFVRQNGFAMSSAGIARHLHKMGGRGNIVELVAGGKSNAEILDACFPDEEMDELHAAPPSQADLFTAPEAAPPPGVPSTDALFETRKMSLKVPADLYEAIRFAAKAEHMSQNDLIVEILTSALSRMPRPDGDHGEDSP